MTHPAHAELAAILAGLADYPLPADVLRTLHAARRVATAAAPLPEQIEVALGRCTTWKALADMVATLGTAA